MLQDLRLAVRNAIRNPGLTLVVALSLAAGIGAGSAIFSLIDALGLRPPPVERPEQLVRVFTGRPQARERKASYPDYLDLRSAPSLQSLAAYGARGAALRIAGGPAEMIMVNVVSPNYFGTMGIPVARGRYFVSNDEAETNEPVAVISWRVWQTQFGGDPQIVGRSVDLDAQRITVVGVAARGFAGLDAHLAVDVWVPVSTWGMLVRSRQEFTERGQRWFTLVGRVREGQNELGVKTELAVRMGQLAAAYPQSNLDLSATVVSELTIRRRVAAGLGALLLAGVGLLLLLGSANAAGMLLGRGIARRREMAIRVAIGASRARLIRQLLTENLLLASLGGVLGVLLGWWLIRLLPALLPPTPVPLGFDFRLDVRVVAFAVLATSLAAVVFGLAPALTTSRTNPAGAMKQDGNRGAQRIGARKFLVAAEMALSLVLLVSGVLVTRSFRAMADLDPGFTPAPMVLLTVVPAIAGYDEPAARNFYGVLAARIGALPGVERVSFVRHFPLSPDGGGASKAVEIPSQGGVSPEDTLQVLYNVVDENYFATLRIPVLQGRAFTREDAGSTRRVVVISDAMARKFWPNRTAVGSMVRIGSPAREYEIVGVVKNGKYNQLTEAPQPYMYLSFSQEYSGEITLIARLSGREDLLMPAIRRALIEVDPKVPAPQLMTLASHMRFSVFVPRMIAILAGVLGIFGVALAMIGVFGIVSFVVRSRTREFGIRMALGAQPGDVIRGVLRGMAPVVGGGLVIGVLAAGAMARLLAAELYGLSGWTSLTVVSCALALLAIAFLGMLVPARGAARADPRLSLSAE